MLKKVLSALLVLLFVFSLCGAAFAEEAKVENDGEKGMNKPYKYYVWKDSTGWIIAHKPFDGNHFWDEYLEELLHTEEETIGGALCLVWYGYRKTGTGTVRPPAIKGADDGKDDNKGQQKPFKYYVWKDCTGWIIAHKPFDGNHFWDEYLEELLHTEEETIGGVLCLVWYGYRKTGTGTVRPPAIKGDEGKGTKDLVHSGYYRWVDMSKPAWWGSYQIFDPANNHSYNEHLRVLIETQHGTLNDYGLIVFKGYGLFNVPVPPPVPGIGVDERPNEW